MPSLHVGDILLIIKSSKTPVDTIPNFGEDLNVNESTQTGETGNIVKDVYNGSKQANCFLILGSQIHDGKGEAVVCAVGVHTQSGMIKACMTLEELSQPHFK